MNVYCIQHKVIYPAIQTQTAPAQKPRRGIPIIDPESGKDIMADMAVSRPETTTSDSSARSTPNIGEVSEEQVCVLYATALLAPNLY